MPIPLDEIDHSPDNHESQRRFAPIVIAEAAIVDRFQLKSVIVLLKFRNRVAKLVRKPTGKEKSRRLTIRQRIRRHASEAARRHSIA